MSIPDATERLRAAIERRVAPDIIRELIAEANAVARAAGDAASLAEVQQIVDNWDFAPGTDSMYRKVYEAAVPAFGVAALDAFRIAYSDRGPIPGPDSWTTVATEYLNKPGVVNIKNAVTRDSQRIIRKVLTDSMMEGTGPDVAARELRRVFPDLARPRAETITRTETLRSASVASDRAARETMNEFGITLVKEWLHSGNPNGRPEHIALDGTRVAMDETFNVGGELALYPRDASLSAEQSANCACDVAYVEQTEQDLRSSPLSSNGKMSDQLRERCLYLKAEHATRKAEVGSEAAIAEIAEREALQFDTIRMMVYGIGYYAQA